MNEVQIADNLVTMQALNNRHGAKGRTFKTEEAAQEYAARFSKAYITRIRDMRYHKGADGLSRKVEYTKGWLVTPAEIVAPGASEGNGTVKDEA